MSTLLSVNNYYYYRGGAETVFFEQNKMFQDMGWRVVPFAMKHPKNLASEWSEYFVDEIEFGQQYSLLQKLVKTPKVIHSFEAQRKLERLIEFIKPDICHAHNIYHHISPSILRILKSRGIPTVLTLHDLKIACPAYNMVSNDDICERCRGGRIYNVVVHRCIKGSLTLSAVVMMESLVHKLLGSYRQCVSRFAVPSRFYIDKLVEWGFAAEQFAHVPNFVDVRRYEPNYAPGKMFLYFGRLSREKGISTLIRATAEAKCSLVIVGTGPQLAELQQLTSQLSADVRFLGYMTGQALHDVVRAARAVVLPSEWYENAPMSVLEAYALGKPVIGARIGGIPELIRENQTGLGFASGDVESLAAAMRHLIALSNGDLQAMSQQARRLAETEFTTERYRENLLAIYRELGVHADSIRASYAS